MGFPLRSIYRPLSVALAAFACLMPLTPASVGAQEEGTPVVEAPPTTEPLDLEPPVIDQPGNVTVQAFDAVGIVVPFVVPTAVDAGTVVVPVSCDYDAFTTLFPIGSTVVTCWAQDAALNQAAVSFSVTVLPDTEAPFVEQPGSLVVDAVDATGTAVPFVTLTATDAISGPVAVSCDYTSGALFPIGTTVVSCWAQDAALNQVTASFTVTVNPLPVTVPVPSTPSEPVVDTTQPVALEPSAPTHVTDQPNTTTTETTSQPTTAVTTEVITTDTVTTATTTEAGTKPSTSTTVESTPGLPSIEIETDVQEALPVAPALALPWPPPGNFVLVTDGGPLGRLTMVWANRDFPVSQEFGHTAFSISQPFMYRYGLAYGLDGYQHTGLDVGMPAGTWLYSPVEGTVKVAGGTPYFTHYGNGNIGVGELLIETDAGDEVVLGHMGAIAVKAGQRVSVGEFVGLSGGYNGDHLHLETRELQAGGGFRIVDPRHSFLIEALASFESPLDDPIVDGQLVDDSIIGASSSYLADDAGVASVLLDERQPGESLLGSGLSKDSIVDIDAGPVVETVIDPFLPEDPLLGGSLLPDFVVDPRKALLIDTSASATALPDDRSLDVGSFDDSLLQDSIVDLESGFLVETRPVPRLSEGELLQDI